MKEVIFLQEKWFFLDSGFNDATINMALDESLLNWLRQGIIPPTLRFYGWSAPSLSVGHFQDVDQTIDFDALQKYNGQFVRRLTGGSAVLHDDELTYSLVISEQHPSIPKTVGEAYYVLSKGVVEGYKNLGISVDYAIPKESARKDRTPVCFEKPAYYEMVIDGKKISGNAQTRKTGVLLQHGSIPMSIDTQMLFDLFHYPSEDVRQRKRKSFADKAITINKITNKTHSYNMLKEAFFNGFQTGLDIKLQPFHLSESQWEEVHQLARSKYGAESWNKHNIKKERISHGEATRTHS